MFSPLHPFQKPQARAGRATRAEGSARASFGPRVGDILLTTLLNYRIVLAAVWVVSVGSWLVLQVLPARPATLDPSERSLSVSKESAPKPILVSDTSTAMVRANESPDED